MYNIYSINLPCFFQIEKSSVFVVLIAAIEKEKIGKLPKVKNKFNAYTGEYQCVSD